MQQHITQPSLHD